MHNAFCLAVPGELAFCKEFDHDVGTSMSAIIFYGLLAAWSSSLVLMAYLMRPLRRHRDAD